MYQRNSRRCCAMMLLMSICLRLCMLLGLDARAAAYLVDTAESPDFARFLLYLETGQVTQAEPLEPETQLVVLQIQQPREQPVEQVEMEILQPVLPKLPAAPAPAEEIPVAGGCTYAYNKAALLSRPTQMDLSADGPTVLIVHTHGSEAYTQESGWEYDALIDYRTLDADRSVIAVGDALAQTLEHYGIGVLHDRTLNDYPSYNDSYWTALEKTEDWLAQYPSIQMVIDIHRDAVEDSGGQALALSSRQNGQQAAQLMLVVGTDQGGLSHPNWEENLANALKLQSVLEGLYPGLCRKIDLRTERFNQHTAPGSLLVEVGTNGNTLRQALFSAQLLGEGIAALFHLLEETPQIWADNVSP